MKLKLYKKPSQLRKQLTPSFPLRASLIALLVMLLGLNACKKDDGPTLPTKQNQVSLGVSSRSNDSISIDMEAFQNRPSEEYDKVGQMLFEYMAYQENHANAQNLIPEALRPAAIAEINDVKSLYATVTDMNSAISVFQNRLPSKDISFYTNYVSSLTQNTNSMANFGEFWFYMRDAEQMIQNGSSYGEKEKEFLLSFSSILRNYVKVLYSRGEFNSKNLNLSLTDNRAQDSITVFQYLGNAPPESQMGGGCSFFGVKLSCIIQSLAPKVAGLVILSFISPDPISKTKLAVAAIEFLISTAFKDFCLCEDAPPVECLELNTCYALADDCGLTQSVLVSSNNVPYAGVYYWQIISGGVFPDYGNGNGVTAATQLPSLRVRQFSPNEPVVLQVMVTCFQNQSQEIKTFVIDIQHAVSHGVMVVDGDAHARTFSPASYYIGGTVLTSPNFTNFGMSIAPSYMGNITNQTPVTCNVVWVLPTPGNVMGEVHGIAFNHCDGKPRMVRAKMLVWITERN